MSKTLEQLEKELLAADQERRKQIIMLNIKAAIDAHSRYNKTERAIQRLKIKESQS